MKKLKMISAIGCLLVGMNLMVGCSSEQTAFKGMVVTEIISSETSVEVADFKGKRVTSID